MVHTDSEAAVQAEMTGRSLAVSMLGQQLVSHVAIWDEKDRVVEGFGSMASSKEQ